MVVPAELAGRAVKLSYVTDDALCSVAPRRCDPWLVFLPGALVRHTFDLANVGTVVSTDGSLALVLWTERK